MRDRIILVFLLLVVFVTAWNSLGYFHPDEHFQLLEFASYKVGNPNTSVSALTWEFPAQIRPAMQVYVAFVAMKFFSLIHAFDPFLIAKVLRFASAVLSLFCFWLLYKVKEKENPDSGLIYLVSAIGLWFLPFLSVRFSSETWSGALFFMALALYMLRLNRKESLGYAALIGLLLGFSFNMRFQTGILIFGFFLWLLLVDGAWKKRSFYVLSFFALIAVFIGVLFDYWLYGNFVFTPWNYADVNILQGKAAEFGTDPWYQYFLWLPEKGLLAGVLILIVSFWFWMMKPKHIFTFSVLPFVLVHCFIAHKEMRFLFPVMFVLPYMITTFITAYESYLKIQKAWSLAYLIAGGCLMLYIMFQPASLQVSAIKEISKTAHGGDWKFYHSGSDPFGSLKPSFYRPQPPQRMIYTALLASEDYLPKQDIVYYSSKRKLDCDTFNLKKLTLIKQRIPRGITENFNLFHWADRTTIDCIYLVEPREK